MRLVDAPRTLTRGPGITQDVEPVRTAAGRTRARTPEELATIT